MKQFVTLILLTVSFTIFLNLKANAQNPIVTIGGEVGQPLKLDSVTITKMKHVNVKGISHFDNKEHLYSGIALSEILKECKAIPGNQLRGKYLANYALITASDGYRAVIALPEIDPAFTDKVIILADKQDGKALPPAVGPFQIVVPGDKRPARCVRQVISIDILSAKPN